MNSLDNIQWDDKGFVPVIAQEKTEATCVCVDEPRGAAKIDCYFAVFFYRLGLVLTKVR